MIDRQTFRNIETKLYIFFQKYKRIQSLKKQLSLLNKQIEKEYLSEQIDNIINYSAAIEDIIKPYNDELKKLLEYKYKNHWNEIKISEVMHLIQGQINKKKQKVINDIECWERWNKKGIKEE